MNFEEALPRLVMAYRKGELVPFIGAGLSCPACLGWVSFVEQLEAEADLPLLQHYAGGSQTNKPKPGPTPIELMRRAERAVQRLRNRDPDALPVASRKALVPTNSRPKVPGQTKALAGIFWPLVLTTNYDDWFLSAAETKPPRLLGRELLDCQEILASLDVVSDPILWALQGFLGGQSGTVPPLPEHTARNLAKQLVIGHQQYQRVINHEPQFRRAFAEVFRRRSLFFIGSGLKEDYLMNLFGEILEHYGVGTLPHFALMTPEESGNDADFMLRRLNVTLISYPRHEDLTGLLNQLKNAVQPAALYKVGGWCSEARFVFDSASDAVLIIRHGKLPLPRGTNEYTAVSAGRSRMTGQLRFGGQMSVIQQAQDKRWLPSHLDPNELPWRLHPAELPWEHPDPKQYVYTCGDCPVLAIWARNPTGGRDLRVIASAVTELIGIAAVNKKTMVHIGLLAGGKNSGTIKKEDRWNNSVLLTEIVRGARNAAANLKTCDPPLRCPSLTIHLIDPGVVLPWYQGKLHIEEVLSFTNLRFWTVVVRTHEQQERTLVIQPEHATIKDIAELLLVPPIGWEVETLPRPSGRATRTAVQDVANQTLAEFGVVVFSTLRFSQSPVDPSENEKQD